jgi:hypothetical protein
LTRKRELLAVDNRDGNKFLYLWSKTVNSRIEHAANNFPSLIELSYTNDPMQAPL